MIGNDLDDEFRGNFLFVARRNDVFQCFFSQFNVDLTVFLQLGKGNESEREFLLRWANVVQYE